MRENDNVKQGGLALGKKDGKYLGGKCNKII
jgi:hypothetical protein